MLGHAAFDEAIGCHANGLIEGEDAGTMLVHATTMIVVIIEPLVNVSTNASDFAFRQLHIALSASQGSLPFQKGFYSSCRQFKTAIAFRATSAANSSPSTGPLVAQSPEE